MPSAVPSANEPNVAHEETRRIDIKPGIAQQGSDDCQAEPCQGEFVLDDSDDGVGDK